MSLSFSRRDCLRAMGSGFGTMALTGLLEDSGLLAGDHRQYGHDLTPRTGHFPAKAKAVIQLFQNGGPSQMDLFDPKPELTRRQGQPHPEEVETFQLGNKNVLLGSPFRFEQHGQSGMQFSEVVPHLAALADDLCMVRSMYTENNNHPFAINMMQTGKTFAGHPAIGSWIGYALGTENHNLPAYVVLRDPAGYNTSGKTVWSSGWLPTLYQGTEFSASGTPVLHLQPSRHRSAAAQVRSRELLAHLNLLHADRHPRENELETRIKNFELAARMQLVASEILDLSRESQDIHRRYGLDNPATAGYGTRCLLARRLIEAGVRFVQVFPPATPDFQPWDNHSKLSETLPKICKQVEQPSATLITDLKERGLLNDVIVMWTGEFGRLPITEGSAGRDHNRNAFTLLMAGGGFQPGLTYGTTDEFGYRAVENRVSVPDLHATILHQLGIDHTLLDYLHMGRAERLTDPDVTGAQVVDQLLS